EVQALVAPSPLGTPRRAVVGWDGNRLAMLLAVLEARCGLVMAGRDVSHTVAGGLRSGEPAADLAVAAALASSLLDVPVPPSAVVFGEVGLAGEVRAVSHAEARLKEAAKLGFDVAILPAGKGAGRASGLRLHQLRRLAELVDLFGSPSSSSARPALAAVRSDSPA
ncbi:MAG TPA: DNA repair protein RadA, partial [Geminicoccaceae bacterium]|nr:DNA repair protein RadA [Geminicoccaceae bacterium]